MIKQQEFFNLNLEQSSNLLKDKQEIMQKLLNEINDKKL